MLRISIALAVLLAAAPLAAQEGQALPEPNARYEKGEFYVALYGDGNNVRLFLGLLKDPDSLVRERAALDLGQTDNRQAAAPLLALLADPDVGVRRVALVAIAQIDPNLARTPAVEALADREPGIVLTGLRLVRELKLSEARQAVEKVLERQEPLLVASSLRTLSLMAAAAPAERLNALLQNPSAAIRLLAAENATLSPAGGGPAESLLNVARDEKEQSQVRAAAMAALGKLAFSSVEPLLAGAAARGDDPTMRRGALRAWRQAGRGDRIRPFLDDESPMVLLAAIEAAGELKQADCLDVLVKLMCSVRDDQAHFAARQSLAQLGTDSVANRVAEELRKAAPELIRLMAGLSDTEPAPGPMAPGPAPGRPDSAAPAAPAPEAAAPPAPPPAAVKLAITRRSVRALSWLLGHYRSKAALDAQIDLVNRLRLDCPALLEVADAMARIGDQRSAVPIRQALGRAAGYAHAHLVWRQNPLAPRPPFDEKVTAALIDAAADLRDAQAVPAIIRLVEANHQGAKLQESAAAAARALPRLVNDTNRQAVEKAVALILSDRRSHGLESTFEACKAAAKLNMNSSIPLLQQVLSERDCRQVIHASAWALGRLTGNTPPLPEPIRRQGNLWIIKIAEQRH